MKATATNIFKETLTTSIQHLREIKADRATPALLGEAWTIAKKDGYFTIARTKDRKGYNFAGLWNRRSVYWTKAKAEKVLATIQENAPFQLDVIHLHTARDRYETVLLGILSQLFPNRHKVLKGGAK